MTTPENARRALDSAALKALAHPLRVDMVDQLIMYGPATASQLAERLDQSSGATSYHLRQLARHGLVREVEGKGTARERWWEVVPGGIAITLTEDTDPASIEAGKLIGRQWSDQRHRQLDAFFRRGDVELPMEWTDSALVIASKLDLTSAELAEVSRMLSAAVEEARAKFADLGPREGTRPVQLQGIAIPLLDVPGERA